jgi:serine protease Do
LAAIGALTVASALALAPMASAPAFAHGAPDGFGDLIEDVSPSVVQITATKIGRESGPAPQIPEQFRNGPFKDFFDRFSGDGGPHGAPRPHPKHGALGSGFIVDDEGIVVTNNHVVSNAAEINVTLTDGREFPATLIGADEKTDLAVLKVETDTALPAKSWGDSDKSRVGDWVLAVGNPFGLGGTATVGIISARGRDIGSGPYDDFIQIDAPINSGNSGGPLFDGEGNVIGVNTAIFSPNGGNVGIGFAIPSNIAQEVVAELRENGTVERGWLGVMIQPVTPDVADSLGLDQPKGALVAKITPDSPAEKAGLRQGDIIVGFDGQDIEEVRDLTRIVANTAVGGSTRVSVWRGEKEIALKVKIGEMPQQVAANTRGDAAREHDTGVEVGPLGLTLTQLDEEARSHLGLGDDSKGVVIAGVDSGKNSAEKGLRPGDVITHVNQAPVDSPDDVVKAVQKAEKTNRKSVLLLIDRQGEQRFVAVELTQA